MPADTPTPQPGAREALIAEESVGEIPTPEAFREWQTLATLAEREAYRRGYFAPHRTSSAAVLNALDDITSAAATLLEERSVLEPGTTSEDERSAELHLTVAIDKGKAALDAALSTPPPVSAVEEVGARFRVGQPVTVPTTFRYPEWHGLPLFIQGVQWDVNRQRLTYAVSESWPPKHHGEITDLMDENDLTERAALTTTGGAGKP